MSIKTDISLGEFLDKLTILEIKAKCRRLKADKGLDLVILDYLQLAHADGRRERKDLEHG